MLFTFCLDLIKVEQTYSPHAAFPGGVLCLREPLIKDKPNLWQNPADSWKIRKRKRHRSSSLSCSLSRSLLQSGFQLLSDSTKPHESATGPSVEVSHSLCGLAKRGLHINLLGLSHLSTLVLPHLWAYSRYAVRFRCWARMFSFILLTHSSEPVRPLYP